MVHTGPSFAMQLAYRKERKRRKVHAQLNYDSYSISSEVEGMRTVGDQGLLQSAMHWRLGHGQRNLRFYAGGVVDAGISYRNNLDDVAIGNNITGEIISSLSPSLLAEKNVGKNRISGQFWVAVFSYVVQPGYAQSYPPDQYFCSFEKMFRMQTRVSYVIVGRRFDGRFDAQLQYYNLDKHQPTRFLNYGLITSLVYKFK